MIKTIKIGEVQTKIIDEVKKTDELKVLLRIGWGAETTSTLKFNPPEDLKIGDKIKVIIEKLYEEIEKEEEVTTEEASEIPKTEGEEEATAEEASETPKAEGEEETTAETG